MKIKNRVEIRLEQGSEEWLAERKTSDGTASELPIAAGKSQYKTRTQLIEEKKGVEEKISSFTQEIFARGHKAENEARDILEEERLESFFPKVFKCEIEGLSLLASLDGISYDGKTIYEHKLWNKELAENTRAGLIDEKYSLQLDQQLLVSGAEEVVFICSDGTTEKKEMLIYKSNEEKFKNIVSIWKQFKIDKENHVFELKKEKVQVMDTEAFPVVKYSVEGSLISTNFDDVKEKLKMISSDTFELLEKEGKTDLDFEIIAGTIKAANSGRVSLKEINKKVVSGFESFEEFLKNVKEVDSILQRMSAAAKKLMDIEKDKLKSEIVDKAHSEFNLHLLDLNKSLKINHQFYFESGSLYEAGKGKKTIDSYKECVNTELANLKSFLSEKFISFKDFDAYLDSKNEFSFLFNDASDIAETYFGKSFLDFKEEIDSRIEQHLKREEEKIQEAIEREKERIEEERVKIEKRIEQEKIHEEEQIRLRKIVSNNERKYHRENVEEFEEAQSNEIKEEIDNPYEVDRDEDKVGVSILESTTQESLNHHVVSYIDSMFESFEDSPSMNASKIENEAWVIVCQNLDDLRNKHTQDES